MSEQPTPEEVAAQAEAVVKLATSAPTEEEAAPEARRGVENDEAAEETPDWETVATEWTADLQRLQAEYVNYRERVDRDRALVRQLGTETAVTDLMPAFDSIRLVKFRRDLGGGFKMMADELEEVAARHGPVVFGVVGDPFDPAHRKALMEVLLRGKITMIMILQVIQPSYQLRDHVTRPTRAVVANPRQNWTADGTGAVALAPRR